VGLSAVDVYVQAPVTSNQKTIILVFAADSCWQYKDPSKMQTTKRQRINKLDKHLFMDDDNKMNE
jgi:hypothetical protein